MTGLLAHALLAGALAWPALLALAACLPATRRAACALSPTLALPALLLAVAGPDATLPAPALFTGALLRLDGVGRAFLLLTALVWSAGLLHARGYMRNDARRTGFTALMMLTALGNIGLTLAGDGLTFYLFFALMTFAAYGLVVHARSADALRAGRVYIVLAVCGEVLLLAGLLTLASHAPDMAFDRVPAAFASLSNPATVATLLLFGFGVKAGMLPVHVWLPLAHPIAPTPASAVLSGAMIKAGVLGWLRFLPLGTLPLPTPGAVALGLGLAATLYAAAVGMAQRDPKTVLAYSSISQIGFLTAGVGGALLEPRAAAALVLAVAAYALHHAPAKAALFLAMASLPAAREGKVRRGWLVLAALPGLVLAGAPLTSGAVAKGALKATSGELPPPWDRIDPILSVAAVGTTLLMARWLATLAAAPGVAQERPTPSQRTAWLGLVAATLVAALWIPAALVPLGELPGATGAGYSAAALWPVALGGALAAAAIVLARRYPAFTTVHVPAGDLIALLESTGRRVAAAGAAAARWWAVRAAGLPRARRGRLLRVARAAAGRLERALELNATFGVIVVVLVAALFIALRGA